MLKYIEFYLCFLFFEPPSALSTAATLGSQSLGMDMGWLPSLRAPRFELSAAAGLDSVPAASNSSSISSFPLCLTLGGAAFWALSLPAGAPLDVCVCAASEPMTSSKSCRCRTLAEMRTRQAAASAMNSSSLHREATLEPGWR